MCISAGQNGARLIKWPEKRLGSSLVLKLYKLHHAQQDFDTISSEVFLLSIFRMPGKTPVIRVMIFEIFGKSLEVLGNRRKFTENFRKG